MKTLYESILDDESVLISNMDKLANWHETVIEYIKKGKYKACAEWLNDHNIKLFKNSQFVGNDRYQYLVYKKDEYDPLFLIFIDYCDISKSLNICFAESIDSIKEYGLKSYLNELGISLKEYNKVKNNIIKNFNVKKHPSLKNQYERKIN